MTKASVAVSCLSADTQVETDSKKCTRCLQIKPLSVFVTEKRTPSGRGSICKQCAAQKARAWAAANREKVATRRQRMAPEQIAAENAKRSAKYRDDPQFAQQVKERAARWYAANRKKVLARMSSPEGRTYSRNRMRDNMRDEGFRIHSNLSRAIRASVKDKARRSWEEVVGYDLATLMQHLERQFTPGMTWQNHGKGRGKWHIDHIVPKASFTFTSVEDDDFKACWALTNLRPMWSEQNISKHAKRLYLL